MKNNIDDIDLLEIYNKNKGHIPSHTKEFIIWKNDRLNNIINKRKSSIEKKKCNKGYEFISPIEIVGIKTKIGYSHKNIGVIHSWLIDLPNLSEGKPRVLIQIIKDGKFKKYSLRNRFNPLNINNDERLKFNLNILKLKKIESYLCNIHKQAICWNEYINAVNETPDQPDEIEEIISLYYRRDNNGNILEKIDINNYLSRFKNFKSWNYKVNI